MESAWQELLLAALQQFFCTDRTLILQTMAYHYGAMFPIVILGHQY
jgi:hypothetical protein